MVVANTSAIRGAALSTAQNQAIASISNIVCHEAYVMAYWVFPNL